MTRSTQHPSGEAVERQALRRRVGRMHAWFNQGAWEKCFALVDPRLREQGKVLLPTYAGQLEAFRAAYGAVRPWHIRIGLHLDSTTNKHDPRSFAYVYVIWQDEAHAFHMFRERWVKDHGQWYTRVAGLVPNREKSAGAD